MGAISAIYRKELLDIARDRKALIFMILLPTVLAPVFMIGLGNLALGFAKRQAVDKVVIAASPESHAKYISLAHDHFTSSQIGEFLQLAQNPILGLLTGTGLSRELVEHVPPGVFHDPAVYAEWTRDLSSQLEEMVFSSDDVADKFKGFDTGALNVPSSPASNVTMANLAEDVFQFYFVNIRGVGLVEFVDLSKLEVPPVAPEEVPANLAKLPDGARIYSAIKNKKIGGYLSIEDDLEGLADGTGTALVTFYHDSTIPGSQEANARVSGVVRMSRESILKQRIAGRKLPTTFMTPVKMERGTNFATSSQIALAALGGLLPYLILTFAFLGGIYPAIDLGVGEKERNTLESLLLSPATRTEIALGKFLVIFTTSLVAAGLGVGSLMVSFHHLIPAQLLERMDITIAPMTALAIGLLAIPPAAAYAGLFLAVSIFARSFKEAQNYLSPLPLVIIVPAGAGLIPGLETTWQLACIPMVNVSLLSRDFLKGDVNWLHYGLTFASCAAFSAICLALCVYMFRREQVLFRT